MKYARVTLVAFAFFSSVVVAACASGNDSVFGDVGGGGAGGNPSATGNGGHGGSGGGMVCPATCKSDADCEASCPPAGTGANCCDMSGMCYVEAAACPGPMMTGASTGASMY